VVGEEEVGGRVVVGGVVVGGVVGEEVGREELTALGLLGAAVELVVRMCDVERLHAGAVRTSRAAPMQSACRMPDPR
jgi:hypothetical protein